MNKSLLFTLFLTTVGTTSLTPAQAQVELVYVAIPPCRIVDTREAGGDIAANDFRNFRVSGTTGELAVQGGETDCLDPKAGTGSKPLAISAYVLAVPASSSGSGVLTAYPSDQLPPAVGAGSTVNFAAGQVIGNTTTITLCDPTGTCPTDGEFAILSRLTNQEVVVDVQGYYYPAAGSCSDDMVAVGNVCVDKYEASLVDDSGAPTTAAACLPDGSDCGGAIFAVSVDQVNPAGDITWYQAAQACANVGKRLPTTVEWQAAAAGTIWRSGPAPCTSHRASANRQCGTLLRCRTGTRRGPGCARKSRHNQLQRLLFLSLIHISEPTRLGMLSRMPSSA